MIMTLLISHMPTLTLVFRNDGIITRLMVLTISTGASVSCVLCPVYSRTFVVLKSYVLSAVVAADLIAVGSQKSRTILCLTVSRSTSLRQTNSTYCSSTTQSERVSIQPSSSARIDKHTRLSVHQRSTHNVCHSMSLPVRCCL